jgi:predicted alpha/beta hydrolase family esterase
MDEFLASSKAKNVRMVTAADDFLLAPGDLEWIAKTFGKRAVIFEHGGHMGELYTPEAKNALVESLKATGQP